MRRQPLPSALLSLVATIVVVSLPVCADAQVRTEGRVVEIHAPRLFTIEEADTGRELLVLAPRPLSGAVVGAIVVVEGSMRRLVAADMRRTPTSYEIDEATRGQFLGRMALVAKSVMASMKGEAAPTTEEPVPPAPQRGEPRGPLTAEPGPPRPLTVRAAMLVDYIDGLAGQEVRILNARVVGVLESNAFLIEPATRYMKAMGHRDRVIVLIPNGALRADQELIVDSTVTILGVVRTLVGVRMTGEVPWPVRLSKHEIERLEVRAAILAASVQTADGVELTDRQPPATR